MSYININDNNRAVNIQAVSGISYKGIKFLPSFDSEGLKIPVSASVNFGESYQVYYQRIPKDVLINMLKEYLPEVLSSIGIEKRPSDIDDIISLTTYGSDTK